MVNKNYQLLLLWLLFLFLTVIILRTAWISDDAAITLRTVLNFAHGNGLVFNAGERVQAYTHTLWFFVLSGFYLIFSNIFISTFIASISSSLLAYYFLIRYLAKDFHTKVFLLLLIILSQALIDYSTSGLENPLSFLLTAIFAWYFDKEKNLLGLTFLMSLIFLNRPDSILLVLPLYLFSLYYKYNTISIKKIIFLIILGGLPVLAWLGFSLFYYGLYFPNTAYAKLNTNISQLEFIAQGIYYFIDSLKYDPLTLIVIIFVIINSAIFYKQASKLYYA